MRIHIGLVGRAAQFAFENGWTASINNEQQTVWAWRSISDANLWDEPRPTRTDDEIAQFLTEVAQLPDREPGEGAHMCLEPFSCDNDECWPA